MGKTMELSDKEIIQRFVSGDQEAFGLITQRWEHRVLNLAYRLTQDLDEALDIRQITFLKLFQKLSEFNGDAGFSTWVYAIVVNLCRDRFRKKKIPSIVMEDPVEKRGPDQALETKEAARLVARAVKNLPLSIREVVVLRHYQNRSFPEIAEIVGAPPSTVKSRMARGLKNLKTLLKELEDG